MAQHTLEECSVWVHQRRVISGDDSLSDVVQSMIGSENACNAVAFFYEEVMTSCTDATYSSALVSKGILKRSLTNELRAEMVPDKTGPGRGRLQIELQNLRGGVIVCVSHSHTATGEKCSINNFNTLINNSVVTVMPPCRTERLRQDRIF